MKKYLLLAGIILLTGCSTKYRESPIATNFKTTEQHKLQSLYHWKVIANDIAKNISVKFKSDNIYLNLTNNTTFKKTFNNLLRDSLINKGYNIVLNPIDANLTIDYDINVVKFDSRHSPINRDNVGEYTLLGTAASGGILITKHTVATDAAAGAAFIAGVGMDIYNYFNSIKTTTSIYEISITLNIKNNKQYVGSVNRVYYIADKDFKLYIEKPKPEQKPTFYIEG